MAFFKKPLPKPCEAYVENARHVRFTYDIRKINGVYREMDCLMCGACYDAKRRTCRGMYKTTGRAVGRAEYREFIERQKTLYRKVEAVKMEEMMKKNVPIHL